MKQVIGFSGVAGCGKDTMFSLMHKRNPKVKRFALADALKKEIYPFLKELYDIDVFKCSREHKDLIRPIMVEHGRIRRIFSNGTYWTSKLTEPIFSYINSDPENIAVITDIRYSVYEKDEDFWLKNILNGHLIHLSLALPNRSGFILEAPNKDEAQNDPLLQKKSDLKITWPKIEPFSIENVELLRHAEIIEKFIRT